MGKTSSTTVSGPCRSCQQFLFPMMQQEEVGLGCVPRGSPVKNRWGGYSRCVGRMRWVDVDRLQVLTPGPNEYPCLLHATKLIMKPADVIRQSCHLGSHRQLCVQPSQGQFWMVTTSKSWQPHVIAWVKPDLQHQFQRAPRLRRLIRLPD